MKMNAKQHLVLALVLTIFLFISCSHEQGQHNPTTRKNQLLLYKIDEERSIYIIDKMRKLSFLNLDSTSKSSTFKEFEVSVKNQEDNDFTLLFSTNEYMLIGSLNRLLNISLTENSSKQHKYQVINMPQDSSTSFSMQHQIQKCLLLKSKPSAYYDPYECGNYVKVAIPLLNDTLLLSCTTNMHNPLCQSHLTSKWLSTVGNDETPKQLAIKYSLLQMPKIENLKRQNVPPFVYDNSIYYFYTSNKMSDGIYKQKFDPVESSSNTTGLKFSEPLVSASAPAILNPNFRSSYGYKDKVYFFFSELDNSENNNDVLYKTPTSFVGEICADDNGEKNYDGSARFVTFKKTIINCYLPDFTDKIHIKYNEIQQVTKPLRLSPNSSVEIFYAIFNLRRANSIDSALCQYRLTSVESSMIGFFKSSPDKFPSKPYSTCSQYNNLSPEEVKEYYRAIKTDNKYQMEQTINSRAMFALNSAKFTSLAVDTSLPQGHVIYIGLENGRLLKLVNQPSSIAAGHTQPIIVAEFQMFDTHVPISDILVTAEESITVVSRSGIKWVQVDVMCEKMKTCKECTDAQDPYCVWSKMQSKCVYFKSAEESSSSLWNEDINDISKCDDDSGILNEQIETTIESNLVYTINEYYQQSQTQPLSDPKYIMSNNINSNNNNKQLAPSIANQKSNSALVILFVIMASLATSILSIFLTCLFIKRNYQVRNKTILYETARNTRPSKHHYFQRRLNMDKLVKFLNRYYFIEESDRDGCGISESSNHQIKIDLNKLEQRQKILNCYEIATSAAVKKDNLKPVMVVCSRPNSSSDSPYTNTTTSSSIESNSNSPNNCPNEDNYLTAKYVSINDTLSSSDEMITKKFINTDGSSNATSSLLINKS